ncbi:MAG: hypothetical protein ABFS41_10445 [Myxococcota bacterium]
MIWLSLLLLIVAFRRGWVVAPMLLFALPFATPVIELTLQEYGFQLGMMVPQMLAGFTVEMVSIAGLAILALHKRQF